MIELGFDRLEVQKIFNWGTYTDKEFKKISMFDEFDNPKPEILPILSQWKSIGYAGIFSCGIAYTLQIIGQKYAEPVLAAIIMSLESVFAALSGWLFLNELMTTREFFGCLIVFLAVIYIQLPSFKRQKNG